MLAHSLNPSHREAGEGGSLSSGSASECYIDPVLKNNHSHTIAKQQQQNAGSNLGLGIRTLPLNKVLTTLGEYMCTKSVLFQVQDGACGVFKHRVLR